MTQRVRRAAALRAEFAVPRKEKVSKVCETPPGLHDFEVTSTPTQTSHAARVTTVGSLAAADRSFFVYAARFTGARTRMVEGANAAPVNERFEFYIKVGGADREAMK